MSSVENMQSALEALTVGKFSTSQAARQFQIPETTLREYAKRKGIDVQVVGLDLRYLFLYIWIVF